MITVSSSDPFSGVSGAAGLETSALMGQASPRTSVRQWALPPIGRSANSSPPAHSALSILEKDLTYLNLLAAVRLDDRQNSLATLELDELRKLWEKFESDPQSDSLVATLAPASAGHDRQAMYWRNRDAPFAAWWYDRPIIRNSDCQIS